MSDLHNDALKCQLGGLAQNRFFCSRYEVPSHCVRMKSMHLFASVTCRVVINSYVFRVMRVLSCSHLEGKSDW